MSALNAAEPNSVCAADRRGNVARSLLGWLALSGPIYVSVSVAQGLLRNGFDFTRHDWSLLANGGPGWIQILNLVLTGAMVVAGAIGIRMALQIVGAATTRAGRWLPRLLGGYGVGLILAGIFTADPADGFPVGTPPGRATTPSWHGLAHVVVGGLGFVCLIAGCLVASALHRRHGESLRSVIDIAVGVIFGLSFIGVASGSSSSWIVLGFTAGVVISFGWLTSLAVELYGWTRRYRDTGAGPG